MLIRYPAMSFRKPKSHRHAEDRDWHQWLAKNEASLKRAGLPPSVTMSAAHWNDFVQNGSFDWHPSDGFSFDQLSLEQMATLLAVLEEAPAIYQGPIIGWLSVRLGRPAAG